VAVYSDADARAAHVRSATTAVRIGPAPAVESYLRGDAIVAAALETGAEAIHPGYGFLAERASFAAAVEAAGLVFVGTVERTIAALGDKLAARRSRRGGGVPVVPGPWSRAGRSAGRDRVRRSRSASGSASRSWSRPRPAGEAGGCVGSPGVEELPASLVAAAAEAESAFGDGRVYLEHEVLPARHIEVQLLGDRAGTVVAIGERDCSLQRRHQKLVEESPAPGISVAERREVHELATRAARAAGLENAATAEFLFDEDRRFWFLEVNTRLQVEHGITELVTDLDLVREQLWIAAGRPLSEPVLAAAERAAEPVRHAIEVRLSAEDPASGFVPTPGVIRRWEMPSGPGVRVDTAIAAGDRVPPDYDPLIAKILVVDADRDRALDRLARALEETVVSGIQTTLPFHHQIAMDPTFRDGPPSIDWVDRTWAEALVPGRADALDAARWVVAGAAARSRRPIASRPASGPSTVPAIRPWTLDGRRRAIEQRPR
jgi:acetyl/propionyl-CoA carboxylase alpha subunit